MNTKDLKKKTSIVQSVSAKEVWKNSDTNRLEEQFMSPFVRDVISDISEITDYELEVEDLEMQVGDFRADIVCKDKLTGDVIVIENQLDKSDHPHLGKSMTYLSNLGAKAIVWICEDLREEHKRTLECLNEITSDEFAFYGLELKFEKFEQGDICYYFNKVVVPSSSVKYNRALRCGSSSKLKSVLWSERLIDDLRKEGCLKARRAKGKPYCFVYRGKGKDNHNIWCIINASGGYVEVGVYEGSDSEIDDLDKRVKSMNFPFCKKQGVKNDQYTKWIYEIDNFDSDDESFYGEVKRLAVKLYGMF